MYNSFHDDRACKSVRLNDAGQQIRKKLLPLKATRRDVIANWKILGPLDSRLQSPAT